jgi:3-dehydroquinate dehydratase-1
MQPNYCLPIIAQGKKEILTTIRQNQSAYSFFEVWLDYASDIDDTFFRELERRWAGKIILLFRRKQLEPIHTPLEERLRILRLLDASSVYVDLDIAHQTRELEYAKKANIQTIVSYHDYQKTPSADELHERIKVMRAFNPSILKIATFCNHEEDALRLLEIQLELKEMKQRHVVLGMGHFGNVTRIFGTLWGNELIFAPIDVKTQSAPGQLTRAQLDRVFQALRV